GAARISRTADAGSDWAGTRAEPPPRSVDPVVPKPQGDMKMNLRNMLTRHAPLAAAIAAAGYAVEGAIVLRAPQGDDNWSASGYICEIAFAVSLVATIVAIAALVAGRGRAARTGGIIAGV